MKIRNWSAVFVMIAFLILSSLNGLSCKPFPSKTLRQVDPAYPTLAKEIREVLLKDNPKIIVIGTGLCDNCKIVENTVETYHKTHPELPITWLVYNQYQDRATFQYFQVTVSPTTFFIDRNNLIQTKLIGAFYEDVYEETLRSVHFID